ncbi:hypothetical protein [Hymenobacter latericus]|uniref:hypothetical protein n=1 Tax=Hymenobacter sp. YIM 151858-1 TaxID=2987688 RepID=UPI002226E1B6|nr:hypothetical protein [Hymenobacter sp. YIM 151858-1]UYZ58413.1 hypothetical protein OIS50_15270 [Hymenobacter sp. YIM 151858-1]
MRVILTILLPLALLAACKPEPVPRSQELFFEVPLTIRPGHREMRLGDTLWVEANYSDSLLDIRTGKRHRVRPQDAQPFTFMSFYQLTGAPERQRGFASAFQVLNRVGRVANLGATVGSFEPVHQDGRYRIKLGLVAVKPGIASITINASGDTRHVFRPGEPLPFIDLGKDTDGVPIRAVLGHLYYTINGSLTNFDLLQQYSKTFSTEHGAHEAMVYYEQKSTFNVIIK